MSWLVLLTPAIAATPLDIPQQDSTDTSVEATAEPAAAGSRKREALMEVNLRARYLMVPEVLLDIGSYNGDDVHGTTGAIHPERPKVRAASTGVEFAIRKDNANGIFYFGENGTRRAQMSDRGIFYFDENGNTVWGTDRRRR